MENLYEHSVNGNSCRQEEVLVFIGETWDRLDEECRHLLADPTIVDYSMVEPMLRFYSSVGDRVSSYRCGEWPSTETAV